MIPIRLGGRNNVENCNHELLDAISRTEYSIGMRNRESFREGPMHATLIEAFRDSGLSIKQLSDQSGVVYAVCHAVVNGNRDPQLSTVERLGKVLGLELKRVRRKGKG